MRKVICVVFPVLEFGSGKQDALYCLIEVLLNVNKNRLQNRVRYRKSYGRLANFDSFNKGKFGSIAFLPFFVVFGVLGFASPVFFGMVSEDTLKDVGEGSKTIDQETLRQMRQNNLGPAEMLLPLTSLAKQKKICGGTSI
jgi:hypothetical protein